MLVGLGLLWIPIIRVLSGQLFVYIQSVQAYISPPIAAVFLIGILWRRVNARGALASLGVGFLLGIARLVLELGKDGLSGWMYWYADINFLHFACFLFLICTAVLVGVSFTAPPPSDRQLAGLTFATVEPEASATGSHALWRRKDLWASLALVLIVTVIWVYFS